MPLRLLTTTCLGGLRREASPLGRSPWPGRAYPLGLGDESLLLLFARPLPKRQPPHPIKKGLLQNAHDPRHSEPVVTLAWESVLS